MELGAPTWPTGPSNGVCAHEAISLDHAGRLPATTLPLVAALVATLHERGIRYCLWKSTSRLAEALAGRTDIDLLVAVDDADAFRALIDELGFKTFLSDASRRYPGLEDHLGYDGSSGRLVHLHVHLALVLGEHFIKNHHLPIEEALLRHTEQRAGVRVPIAELELAVLTVRALLKYRDVDAVKDIVHVRRRGLPADVVEEVRELAPRVDADRLRAVLTAEMPFLPLDLVLTFVGVATGVPRAGTTLLRLRSRLRRTLRPFERERRAAVARRYLRARLVHQWPISVIAATPTRRQAKRKRPARGGATVAVVGIDGAGKTEIVRDISEWLGWRVWVRTEYLGSARPSRATSSARSVSRALEAGRTRVAGAVGADSGATRVLAWAADVSRAIRYLGEARDRSTRAATAREAATAGALVVCDRYPIPSATLDGRYVDGPRIASLSGAERRRVLRWLSRLEGRRYRSIAPPDRLIVLDVAADQSGERKPVRDPALQARKAAAMARVPTDRHVIHVDAGRPLDVVRRDVRAIVWAIL